MMMTMIIRMITIAMIAMMTRTKIMILMFFHLRSAHEEESVEYLTYDQQALILSSLQQFLWMQPEVDLLDLVFQAMVGDLGGYLGLFLGWSLYSLLAEVHFSVESNIHLMLSF